MITEWEWIPLEDLPGDLRRAVQAEMRSGQCGQTRIVQGVGCKIEVKDSNLGGSTSKYFSPENVRGFNI
jgi:hypothetical protein